MNPQTQQHPQILVVGPDGIASSAGDQDENAGRERPVTEMVEQPAKVMRFGNMIRQLLEEVRVVADQPEQFGPLVGRQLVIEQPADQVFKARVAHASTSSRAPPRSARAASSSASPITSGGAR